MPNNEGSSATQLLLKDLGTYLNMNYKCSGSGSHIIYIPDVLKTKYGYHFAKYTSYNFNDVYNSLANQKRPVVLGGYDRRYDPVAGHAWVCDGVEVSYDYYCVPTTPGNYTFNKVLSRKFLHMIWGANDPIYNSFYEEGYFNISKYEFNDNIGMVIAYP